MPGNNLSEGERRLVSQLANGVRWANVEDRSAETAAARAALRAKFERQVDPDGTLGPVERAKRADAARRAYYAGLAFKSAKARRKAPSKGAAADEAVS